MQSNQNINSDVIDIALLEEMYERFKKEPNRFDHAWRVFFQNFEGKNQVNNRPRQAGEKISGLEKLYACLEAYRRYGHFHADMNPISFLRLAPPRSLPSENESIEMQLPAVSPDQWIAAARLIYCGPVGFECWGLYDQSLEKWILDYIENHFFQNKLSVEQQKKILHYLNRSELFEVFLHTKYPGQKRFSIEGAETLIPMLALFLDSCEQSSVEEVVFGMAHRGRLNVLINILEKSTKAVFAEFDEAAYSDIDEGMGDVKYHKGFYKHTLPVKLTLCPNPSHLESVNCVVEGQVRSKQLLLGDQERAKVIPVLIHGDASIAGQGIVYETLQLSRLSGYTTGGTIHIVINNQIGFTTLPKDLQSTHYCTDIAKAFGLPIFHVNAEDPENCARVMLLAFEIRQKFHSDVFIDLICYRKYGHNESDEPAFTQPHEYKIIKAKKPIRELYRDFLIQENIVSHEDIENLEREFHSGLNADLNALKQGKMEEKKSPRPVSNHFKEVVTGVDSQILKELAEQFSRIPENFSLHPKIANLVKERLLMASGDKPVDWGMAETLAYATLLTEGMNVRLSGQDSERGTFSHRHALWVDQNEERDYFPLAHLSEDSGLFEAINSPLSEMSVLGFEYGYSVAMPNGLTIWEAQFGDFCNSAQVIIDQYIASGEQKWDQKANLVLYLPHGYEGQGPEHSSARMERFLTLAGQDNMFIVNPTTPAQLFHLLRRHMKTPITKPLVVFTPKGLLRHPLSVSPLSEFSTGKFQTIIDDAAHPKQATKIVLCSGRFYYDLWNQRAKLKQETTVALIRVEQLYPLNKEAIEKMISSYRAAKEYIWAQEEPSNMGAWTYIAPHLNSLVPSHEMLFVGRERSASPATGFHSRHDFEHANLLKQVFE